MRSIAFFSILAIPIFSLYIDASATTKNSRCADLFQSSAVRPLKTAWILGKLAAEDLKQGTINFANQNDVRARPLSGGSCGPVCVANVFQGINARFGFSKSDPYAMVEELFANVPGVKNGELSPQKMYESLSFLRQKFDEGKQFKIVGESLDGLDPKQSDWINIDLVRSLEMDQLRPGFDDFKIVLFQLFSPGGPSLFHYAIVRDASANTVDLLDPNDMRRPILFFVKKITLRNAQQNMLGTLQLVPDVSNRLYHGWTSNSLLLINSVFTLSFVSEK